MGVPSALSRGQPDWDLRALFEELFMILQWLEQIMTSCGHHSLLLRDLTGTLKDLIMTLYRCHLCHSWGLPIGLLRYTGHDNLASVRLWLGTSEPLGRGEGRSTAKLTLYERSASCCSHFIFWPSCSASLFQLSIPSGCLGNTESS